MRHELILVSPNSEWIPNEEIIWRYFKEKEVYKVSCKISHCISNNVIGEIRFFDRISWKSFILYAIVSHTSVMWNNADENSVEIQNEFRRREIGDRGYTSEVMMSTNNSRDTRLQNTICHVCACVV